MKSLGVERYFTIFKKLLSKEGGKTGGIEWTEGNWDNSRLVPKHVATITTDFCEIGFFHGSTYLVFVISSEKYNKKLFNAIRDFPEVKIYGFKDFKTNLYPVDNFNYEEFEKKIKEDKYFQIQFNFSSNPKSVGVVLEEEAKELLGKYLKIKDIFVKSGVDVVNQLEIDLTKGN